jgi:hypothetical protein
MPTDVIIEQRLAAVEAAIADIQHQLELIPPAPDWVERFSGSFRDEPAFGEVIAYGREIREADRPGQGEGP